MFTSQRSQRGVTLLELVLAIMVIGITFSGAYQGFLYMLKISEQPLIEKQAVQLAFSLFHLIEEGKVVKLDIACQAAFITQGDCQSHYYPQAIDLLPFYQEASYHQFSVYLQKQSADVQQARFELWSLNLTDKKGRSFYFSRLMSNHER